MILNGKENKEATAIYFEIRVPKKRSKELLRKVPSKIYGSNLIMEKNRKHFWFVDISEYHIRAMGLLSIISATTEKLYLEYLKSTPFDIL